MRPLCFGCARRTITPRLRVSLAGYFNLRYWENVLDDLEVRAAVFEQDGRRAFFVQFDLLVVSHELYLAVMEALRAAGVGDVHPGNMIMTATHTHTAPEVRLYRDGANPDYIPWAAARAAEAVAEARDAMAPGTTAHATAVDGRFQFNRRYWMKDGTVVTNPGKRNPDIRAAEGDLDPEIPLLAFGREGKIKLLVAGIVNHGDTIGGNDVSADWPGFTRRALEQTLGNGAMAIPLIGASGNINHFDVATDAPQTRYAEAERIGCGYAETVAAALDALVPFAAELRVVARDVTLRPRELEPAEVDAAQAVIDRYPKLDVENLSGRAWTSQDLAGQDPVVLKYFAVKLMAMREHREPMLCRLTGFLFGRAALVTLPCEPFVEVGLALRKEILRGQTALVASLANGFGNEHGGSGYIPNPWNYGRGGYETTPRSNPVEKQAAAILLNAWRAELSSEAKCQPQEFSSA